MNKLLQRATLAVAALTLASGTAFAAAGDACKWNMGISAGYAITGKPTKTLSDYIEDTTGTMTGQEQSGKLKSMRGLVTNVNIGYAMNDNVRFSFGVGYAPKLKIKGSAGGIRNMTGVATAYYDFVNDTMVTPFLSLGVGMQSAKMRTSAIGVTERMPSNATSGTPGVTGKVLGGADDLKTKRSTSVRGEFGAGLGFKVSDGVHLELGYKLANTPRVKATQTQVLTNIVAGANSTTKSTDTELNKVEVTSRLGSTIEHSLSLGVRFNF